IYKTSLRSLSRTYQEEQRTNRKIIDLEKEGTSIKQKEENQMLEYKLHLLICNRDMLQDSKISDRNHQAR
ncbi:MAG: hypothetical protein Q8P51_01485, partial [Ignavibacteria bacterium]|nr:hypothetical protein [Ignavibacteria bacterium]